MEYFGWRLTGGKDFFHQPVVVAYFLLMRLKSTSSLEYLCCVCVEVRFFRHLKKSCGNSMILVVSFGAGCFKKCVGVVFFVVSGGGS